MTDAIVYRTNARWLFGGPHRNPESLAGPVVCEAAASAVAHAAHRPWHRHHRHDANVDVIVVVASLWLVLVLVGVVFAGRTGNLW